VIKALLARLQQGHRTVSFPKGTPVLPERFRGRPIIDSSKCASGCKLCVDNCPTGAIQKHNNALTIDLGRCLFCAQCERNCSCNAITFSGEYRLAARSQTDLIYSGQEMKLADALDRRIKKLFGRSLKLRQVSAGGCNGCEADTNVLSTVVYDLGRFGIQFVASPRHADGLLITGPVTENMKLALEKTYDAVPDPKITIAVGACAVSGGPYIDLPCVHNGADKIVPVDLFIPGCPPHPLTILDGLLRLIGRLK
jgi:Ni,Fe-hydrogenase III small subunit/NAD-dependent dihydropyrimidine dehydrogenase PreA subunit